MLGITEIFIALVACLLIFQFLKLQWMRTQLPPGPVPLPIIGNLWLLDFKLRRETLSKVFIYLCGWKSVWIYFNLNCALHRNSLKCYFFKPQAWLPASFKDSEDPALWKIFLSNKHHHCFSPCSFLSLLVIFSQALSWNGISLTVLFCFCVDF